MIPVRFKVTSKFIGAEIIQKLRVASKPSIQAALNHLQRRIQRKLSAVKGSVSTDKIDFVFAKESSSPGSPPYLQTGNLHNSVRTTLEVQKTQVKGRVSSPVHYAKTLENGGFTRWSGQQHLRFTDKKLINPIRKSGIPIAPRPVWRPTFEEENARMLEIIKVDLRDSI